jgi:hypothetical protein
MADTLRRNLSQKSEIKAISNKSFGWFQARINKIVNWELVVITPSGIFDVSDDVYVLHEEHAATLFASQKEGYKFT